jgi:hypothetical protein
VEQSKPRIEIYTHEKLRVRFKLDERTQPSL